MPGLTGVDLAQRIRRLGDVPVILTTGAETHDLCTGAEAYGAVACLTKPINLDELLWTIDTAAGVSAGLRRRQRLDSGPSGRANQVGRTGGPSRRDQIRATR